MKDRDKPGGSGAPPSSEELEALLPTALRARALGIPETELEVAALEDELAVELAAPLPAALGAPPLLAAPEVESPRATATLATSEGRSLQARSAASARAVRAGVVAVVVAAAASVSFSLGKRHSPGSSEPALGAAATDAAPERGRGTRSSSPPLVVELETACGKQGSASHCCAGAACAASAGKVCPSGRSCVSCELGEPGLERWRVRFGELWLSARGEQLLAGHPRRDAQAALSLCLSVGRSGRRACRSASGAGTGSAGARAAASEEPGAFLVSSAELLSGFSVDVVSNDDGARLGSWSTPVQINPGVLCSGVLAKPTGEGGAQLGAASFFFDDAEYVEVATAANVAEAERVGASLRVRGAELKLFETTRSELERFALAIGPLSFADAQRVRWQLLKAGSPARVSAGEGFIEPARVVSAE